MKKYIPTILLVLTCNVFFSQQTTSGDPFYINVFINHEKEIRVEANLVKRTEIGKEVKDLIYNHPFKVDQPVIFRIYADKSLDLGYIIKTEQKMLEAYNYQVKRERYLLETLNMNLDGPDWLEKIRALDLKPIRG